MYFLICLFVTSTIHTVQTEEPVIKTANYSINFPKLHAIDSYYNCPKENSFCTANVKLMPSGNQNVFYKELEDYSKSITHYNRTVVKRTLCIPAKYADEQSKNVYIENRVNEENEIKSMGFSSKVYYLECMARNGPTRNLKITLIYLSFMVFLILCGTAYDYSLGKKEKFNMVEDILLCFSLLHYRKTNYLSEKQDMRNLKCIQSIRTLQTVAVILAHATMLILQKHISNPRCVEDILEEVGRRFLLKIALVLVQTYFVITSWLSTNQLLSIYKHDGHFTMRHACLMLIHRIFRILPTLIIVHWIFYPILFYYYDNPGSFEVLQYLENVCSKNLWMTLTFSSNYVNILDTCHLGYWSLVLDMQYYILNLILIYIMINYQLNYKKVLGTLFVIIYFVNVTQAINNGIQLKQFFNIETVTNLLRLRDESYNYLYFGFLTNFNMNLLGIIFGYLYSLGKYKKEIGPYEKYCWFISISCMLTYLCFPDFEDTHPTLMTLVIPLQKILFSLGMTIMIYGLSRNAIQGSVKKFFENKLLCYMGNFTYCTYLAHFLWVFSRGSNIDYTIDCSYWFLLTSSFKDVVVSFILGFFLTLTTEIPFTNLKKLILPPVWKSSYCDLKEERENYEIKQE